MTGRNVDLQIEREAGGARRAAAGSRWASPSARRGGKPLVDRRVASTCAPARSSGSPGVAGNGQSELVEALVGLRGPTPARFASPARSVGDADVAAHRAAGLAYIPEDRASVGVGAGRRAPPTISPWDSTRRPPLSRAAWLDAGAMAARARALIAQIRRQDRQRTRAGRLALRRQSAEGGRRARTCRTRRRC